MFSGGEKQKLAFSRCVYSDNPNILLDEFSSALDTYSEYELTQKNTSFIKRDDYNYYHASAYHDEGGRQDHCFRSRPGGGNRQP